MKTSSKREEEEEENVLISNLEWAGVHIRFIRLWIDVAEGDTRIPARTEINH